jgi:hypothetical protein
MIRRSINTKTIRWSGKPRRRRDADNCRRRSKDKVLEYADEATVYSGPAFGELSNEPSPSEPVSMFFRYLLLL